MTTLIIEDEPLVAKDLENLLLQIDPSIRVAKKLDSVSSTIEYLTKNDHPDCIFMDIQLNDGVSFELFEKVEIKCPIIFTTAYNEYAIRAFKVNSIGYLLKPVDKQELTVVLEKFRNLHKPLASNLQTQLQLLINQISAPKEAKIFKERFIALAGKSHVIIHYSEIACFHKDSIIYIITNDNQRFISEFQTMDEIEELVDPKVFFRANRQLILNSNAINGFRSDVYGKLVVTLKPPLKLDIDISREKSAAFKKWIE